MNPITPPISKTPTPPETIDQPRASTPTPISSPEAKAAQIAPPPSAESQAEQRAVLQERQASLEVVQRAIEVLNQAIGAKTTFVKFELDQDSGHTVVVVMDQETNTLIRQFPSEEAVQLSRTLKATEGILLKTRA